MCTWTATETFGIGKKLWHQKIVHLADKALCSTTHRNGDLQVQPWNHAYFQPLQELQLLLGICSICVLFCQSPSLHCPSRDSFLCCFSLGIALPVGKLKVRPVELLPDTDSIMCLQLCIVLSSDKEYSGDQVPHHSAEP